MRDVVRKATLPNQQCDLKSRAVLNSLAEAMNLNHLSDADKAAVGQACVLLSMVHSFLNESSNRTLMREGNEVREFFRASASETGFDQALLQEMHVDKRLDGVQAVQTLSRVNAQKIMIATKLKGWAAV